MEAGFASQTSRLHKSKPFGHWIWVVRTQPVLIVGLQAFSSWRGQSSCAISRYLIRFFVPLPKRRCLCRWCLGWTSSRPNALVQFSGLLPRWSTRDAWIAIAFPGRQSFQLTPSSLLLLGHATHSWAFLSILHRWGELLNNVQLGEECPLRFQRLPIVSDFLDTRSTLHGSSYGWTLQN